MNDVPLQHVPWPALLRQARRTYGTAMRAALARAGHGDIPANGLHVIGGLALGAGGVPVGRLAAELGITKQGAGQLVETLVARGYLVRTPKEGDRRQLVVALTERGHAAAAVQMEAGRTIDAALADAVGPADLDGARRALGALIEIGLRSRRIEDDEDHGRE
jgi:DNA-binding MarR family transcriptional regulator